MTWHVLDVGSVWVQEFASALSGFTSTLGWLPDMQWLGLFKNLEFTENIPDPPLTIRHFPLQRGYSRFLLANLVNIGVRQSNRLLRASSDPRLSPLICTTPFYASVAERWPGPVVYYQTDLTIAYAGANAKQIRQLDARLCKSAALVCPNSRRVADYMVAQAGCDPAKILIVPNATRASNILSSAPSGPGPIPEDLQDLPRPIVGVLGNLAANLDWVFLSAAVENTPSYSWAFVGSTEMPVYDTDQRLAREKLMRMGGRVRFTGKKPYRELQGYARCVDVAVLPYRRKEPTYSGSSTRFYEHLAACRPILATVGFEELLHQEPLLKLARTWNDLVDQLEQLRSRNFSDGLEDLRWRTSLHSTWETRAAMIVCALQDQCGSLFDASSRARELINAYPASLTPYHPRDFQLISAI